MTPGGTITTIAGKGSVGYSGDGGLATQAEIGEYIFDLAVDAAGNLYIADYGNNVIRRVDAATQIITTIAGTGPCAGYPGSACYNGDGGPATGADLTPEGLTVDAAGSLYIADSTNQRIRRVAATDAQMNFATSIGSSSAVDIATVSNVGNAPLDFSAIASSTNFATDPGTTTCSTSSGLAAGDSCKVGVVFEPTSVGTVGGTLTVSDNSLNVSGSEQQVQLSGKGGWPTSTSVTSSSILYTYGQSVTLTATVSSSEGVPTGTVNFWDGYYVGSATLNANGVATLPNVLLNAGSYNITAVYGGDSNFASSTSAAVSVTVNPITPTLTWSTPAPITYGTPLSATQLDPTANISCTWSFSPTSGTVLSVGSYTLSATCTPYLPPPGGQNYTSATVTVRLIVNPSPSTPTVTVAPSTGQHYHGAGAAGDRGNQRREW